MELTSNKQCTGYIRVEADAISSRPPLSSIDVLNLRDDSVLILSGARVKNLLIIRVYYVPTPHETTAGVIHEQYEEQQTKNTTLRDSSHSAQLRKSNLPILNDHYVQLSRYDHIQVRVSCPQLRARHRGIQN